VVLKGGLRYGRCHRYVSHARKKKKVSSFSPKAVPWAGLVARPGKVGFSLLVCFFFLFIFLVFYFELCFEFQFCLQVLEFQDFI
jgi:hypothetical protein